jgi:hypothetical protein
LRQRRPATNDDEIDAGRGDAPRRAIGFAQPTACPVTTHGAANLATHGEAHTARPVARSPEDDHRRSLDSLALLEERLEFGAGGEPFRTTQPPAYTVSRLRPFARRRLSVLRPPFVFMRSRKPCVFFRRRTFG